MWKRYIFVAFCALNIAEGMDFIMINFTHYVFAFFIFMLVLVIIYISKKVEGKNSGDSNAFYEKEKRLFKLYQNLEDIITSSEEYMEETRSEVAADREKISQMQEKISHIYRDVRAEIESKAHDNVIIKREKTEPAFNISEIPKEAKKGRNKNELVRYLNDKGMDVEQISKELGISKGEVVLIISLNR